MEIKNQWLEYWSENSESLVWNGWVQKYPDYIDPEYLKSYPSIVTSEHVFEQADIGDDLMTEPNNSSDGVHTKSGSVMIMSDVLGIHDVFAGGNCITSMKHDESANSVDHIKKCHCEEVRIAYRVGGAGDGCRTQTVAARDDTRAIQTDDRLHDIVAERASEFSDIERNKCAELSRCSIEDPESFDKILTCIRLVGGIENVSLDSSHSSPPLAADMLSSDLSDQRLHTSTDLHLSSDGVRDLEANCPEPTNSGYDDKWKTLWEEHYNETCWFYYDWFKRQIKSASRKKNANKTSSVSVVMDDDMDGKLKEDDDSGSDDDDDDDEKFETYSEIETSFENCMTKPGDYDISENVDGSQMAKDVQFPEGSCTEDVGSEPLAIACKGCLPEVAELGKYGPDLSSALQTDDLRSDSLCRLDQEVQLLVISNGEGEGNHDDDDMPMDGHGQKRKATKSKGGGMLLNV